MFKAIKARREFKRQVKQDMEESFENIGMDPDEESSIVSAPTAEDLQAQGLSQAAAEAYRFMWDYLTSQKYQDDLRAALDGKRPSYAKARERLAMMSEFMLQYQAVMDAIHGKKIQDPDLVKVEKTIPRLLRQAWGGSVAEFFQARNYLINIASGQSCF